jgi:hypothetical protein
MKLEAARELAEALMRKHGVDDYTFGFGKRMLSMLGQEGRREKVIVLSHNLTLMNDRAVIEEAILHEIAHAIVMRHVVSRYGPRLDFDDGHSEDSHGPTWLGVARSMGSSGEQYVPDGLRVYHAWTSSCPTCGWTNDEHRRLTRTTCRTYGREPDWTRNPSVEDVSSNGEAYA